MKLSTKQRGTRAVDTKDRLDPSARFYARVPIALAAALLVWPVSDFAAPADASGAAPRPAERVRLVAHATMPAAVIRPGAAAGQFNDRGERAAHPRFAGQPVQGISSIKPGSTQGTWWALSDNGFGTQANSSDYRLCIYLLKMSPRRRMNGTASIEMLRTIELRDPNRFFPWRLINESTADRALTGADADPESLVLMPDGSFWIGEEFGPWLLHFSANGELLAAPVEPPDALRSPQHPLVLAGREIATLRASRGFEGLALAADAATLIAMLEGSVSGDPPGVLRLYRYEIARGRWVSSYTRYRLDADARSIGELTRIDAQRFAVIERDDAFGTAARVKRVYRIDSGISKPDGVLAKSLVADLLDIDDPRRLATTDGHFRFPYYTIESLHVIDARHLLIVNDNNFPATGGRGADTLDVTEWAWLELRAPL
jgi:hypothetical protein